MTNDDIVILMQLSIIQNNLINKWFTEPGRYIMQLFKLYLMVNLILNLST